MYASEERNRVTQYAFGNELAYLREIAKDAEYALMIGAGPGVMAIALMEGNPELKLIVVDIDTCYYAKTHLEDAGFYGIGYWVDDSSEYGKDYVGPKLDLLIIDGDHSKEGVIKDVKAWLRHTNIGGILFFHDYENINADPNNGVKEGLTELLNSGILRVEELSRPGISIVYGKL